MKALEKLDSHLKNRLNDLSKAKGQGRKIIGYAAGGYLPEELILACDAIPIGFVQAGDNRTLRDAVNYTMKYFDPFWRAQVGLAMSGKDPWYNIVDFIVTAMTDTHSRLFATIVDYYGASQFNSWSFGVPHHTKDESALKFYLHGLSRFKDKLEEFTGFKITDAKLKKAITLCNKERELFKEISTMRRSKDTAVTSRDAIALHHGSFIADKKVMVGILESYIKEAKQSAPVSHNGRARIFLTGSTLARGDYKVMDLIEAAGGTVVMEEFSEGIRPYQFIVKTEGDLMANIARAYYMDRVCAGWFRPVDENLAFILQQAKDYNAEGVVWYHGLYRESFKIASHFFPKMLKEATGLSMLLLETEYDKSEIGQMTTRVETFMESIKEASNG
jgi:benzoyl-CoA reductase/2-hydroxyglutaryl-CoA dehydratase subunit BcrC/BadD/HgdB